MYSIDRWGMHHSVEASKMVESCFNPRSHAGSGSVCVVDARRQAPVQALVGFTTGWRRHFPSLCYNFFIRNFSTKSDINLQVTSGKLFSGGNSSYSSAPLPYPQKYPRRKIQSHFRAHQFESTKNPTHIHLQQTLIVVRLLDSQ